MRRLALLLAAGCCLLASCSSDPAPRASSPVATPTTTPAPATTAGTPTISAPPPSTPSTSPSVSTAQRYLARLSLEQVVGQLFMVDCPSTGLTAATQSAISTYQVGSVILGNNDSGVAAIAALTKQLQSLAPNYLGLFVATDQEGGQVQRLRGPGFTDIPPATEQGQLSPAKLQVQATVWGGALRAAGVNVDLAPVLDVVPAGFGSNPPVGDLDREYGHTPQVVADHSVAVIKGLEAAGVDATGKHFPGLGRVSGNTDTTAGVTDSVTTATDPYLQPFRAAIKADVPFLMVSTAIYTLIDPTTPAAFSKPIVTDLLRTQLGFKGVVISDDLGAAKSVAAVPVPERAVDFLAAGGDMVLTVDASQIPAMTAAALARAKADPAFRALVDAAALRILTAKAHRGLLD